MGAVSFPAGPGQDPGGGQGAKPQEAPGSPILYKEKFDDN